MPRQSITVITAEPPKLTIDSTAFAGQVGVGVEYFLNRHISFGLSLPAYLYPDLDTTVTAPNGNVTRGHANFSGLAPQIQVKAYLN